VKRTDDIASLQLPSVSGAHGGIPHGTYELSGLQQVAETVAVLEVQMTQQTSVSDRSTLRHRFHCQQVAERESVRCICGFEKEVFFAFQPLRKNIRYRVIRFAERISGFVQPDNVYPVFRFGDFPAAQTNGIFSVTVEYAVCQNPFAPFLNMGEGIAFTASSASAQQIFMGSLSL